MARLHRRVLHGLCSEGVLITAIMTARFTRNAKTQKGTLMAPKITSLIVAKAVLLLGIFNQEGRPQIVLLSLSDIAFSVRHKRNRIAFLKWFPSFFSQEKNSYEFKVYLVHSLEQQPKPFKFLPLKLFSIKSAHWNSSWASLHLLSHGDEFGKFITTVWKDHSEEVLCI